MTTENLQVDTSVDDGYSYDSVFDEVQTAFYSGGFNSGGTGAMDGFARFSTGVADLSSETIQIADYIVRMATVVGSPLTKVFADDSAGPTAPTNRATHTGKTRTTAGVDFDGGDDNIDNTVSIIAVIQELADSYTTTAIQILHDDDGSTTSSSNYQWMRSYNFDTSLAPKLDITHVTGGAGPLVSRRLLSGTGR